MSMMRGRRKAYKMHIKYEEVFIPISNLS
jgi:hypothetical protein